MVIHNLKNLICKPVAGKYFLFGMIFGLTIGLLLMAPLNKFTIDTSLFTYNQDNLENISDTSNYVTEGLRHLKVDETLADRLHDEVKILCWILTGPKNHELKAKHVKATWGKRCNRLIFMSTKEDPSLPSVALPVIEDRPNLWGKTKEAFKHVYQNYYDKYDWFFKADDDTYVIVENLRYLLRSKNTSSPIYYGFRFSPWVAQGYMSGGAGYVLSKEALRRFINESLPDPKKCKQGNEGNEDVEMGKCLESVNVIPGDSRDAEGKTRFLPIFASPLISAEGLPGNHWLWGYNYYPLKTGLDCCSDNIISIHYVDPRTMYLLEYLIYHVKPFGLPYNPKFFEKSAESENQTNKTVQKDPAKTIVTKENATEKNQLSWKNFK